MQASSVRRTLLAVGMLLGAAGLAPMAPAAAATGIITVTVQDGTEGGAPLPGATVTAYAKDQTCPSPPCAPDWVPAAVASGASAADGTTTLVVEVGIQVKIRVTKQGYEGPGWVGDNSPDTTYVDAAAYSATASPTKALFQKRRMVSVTVLDQDDDSGLVGATVGLYPASGDGTSGPTITATVDDDWDADFLLRDPALSGGVPFGDYKIRATRSGYIPGWFSTLTNDWAGATVVHLSEGAGPQSPTIWLAAGTAPPPPPPPPPPPVTPQVTSGTPAITGVATVGGTLAVAPGTWSPAPPATSFTYQWLRGTIVVGSSATYTAQAADLGTQLTVVVTGSAAGHTPASASALSAPVAAATFATTPKPKISGKAKRGALLTASAKGWSPTPDSLTYRWYRGAKAIAGATKKSYRLNSKDVGKHITVKVTAARAGFTTTTVKSQPTAVVKG